MKRFLEKQAARCVSGLLALMILVTTCVPLACALDGPQNALEVVSPVLWAYRQYLDWKDAHPNSSDDEYTGFHPGGSLGGGTGRPTYEEFEKAYTDYAQSLPVKTYNSGNRMVWQVTTEDVTGFYWAGFTDTYRSVSGLTAGIEELDDGSGYYIRTTLQKVSSPERGYGLSFIIRFPYDGEYRMLASPRADCSVQYSGGTRRPHSVDYGAQPSFTLRNEGGTVRFFGDTNSRLFDDLFAGKEVVAYAINWYLPVFEYIPVDLEGELDLDIRTRPTSITGGNYGVVGDNNQITQVGNGTTIVNETTNTYYNPVTGETQPIKDWSYDYSDRSYSLNLGNGDKTKVTYGDQNITITETVINETGDTVTNNYTIYYVLGGTDNPETPDTPTTPGGNDKPSGDEGESIWDKLGTLLGTLLGGLIELVETLLGAVFDAFIALLTMLLERLQVVVDAVLKIFEVLPALFGGFLAFLSAVFPYLPEELMAILTFGVIAVVAIGIFKGVRH